MTLAVFALGIAAVLLMLFVGGQRLFQYMARLTAVLEGVGKVQEEYVKGPRGAFESRMRHLEDMVELLPQRWEHIKKEAERFDGRARSAISRVTGELEERGLTDDTIAALAGEIREADGGPGAGAELFPVPAELEAAPEFAPQMSWQDEIRAQVAQKRGN
jgi:hypothetical protein